MHWIPHNTRPHKKSYNSWWNTNIVSKCLILPGFRLPRKRKKTSPRHHFILRLITIIITTNYITNRWIYQLQTLLYLHLPLQTLYFPLRQGPSLSTCPGIESIILRGQKQCLQEDQDMVQTTLYKLFNSINLSLKRQDMTNKKRFFAYRRHLV